ncbi:PREDICTED: uncharacterized protein LOC104811805 [Tarenaya hassleriana]|uniref:uncharacterized protein LOC104811805 n=1 Tax=Tarenaya hassleriana TaxID=28532 RepID=UPI00053C92FA|nr:PREDICTED: uncharacterized protein LOC104811805 [Tarenaya hassleriana]
MCNQPTGQEDNSNHPGRSTMDSGSVNSPSVSSPTTSSNEEPPRVKFLCSFLGNILPRPQDGKLRYVGGETRIVSVPRDIKYEELMNKMRELYDGDTVLKYQQPDEDLDALVSVVNDDDVTNMMEEYDKLDSGDGFTRLRIFLFSHPDQDGSLHFVDSDERETERRYVDALNNLNEVPEFRKMQQPESPRFNPLDDFHIMEPMLNQLSFEGGGPHSQRSSDIPVTQYNLHQLTIPRVGSGQFPPQRYGEVEGTWSPYYSPRQHDPRTFQEFPASPSSARYRVPYGDLPEKGFDKMPEEYVRQQASHHPLYDLQAQVPENVVWVPAGAMPADSKGGFPGNVLHNPGVYEGSSICGNCRVAFHRNQQHFEQPNLGNGFPPVPPTHCEDCPPNRESFLLNADQKLHHGIYSNEAFGHERGWIMQHQVNPNPALVEEVRSHISSVGRSNDHYVVDGPGTSYPLGHGNPVDGHHTPSDYVQHRAGHELPNEVVHDKPLGGGPLNSHFLPGEECGFRYGNHLYAPGPEGIHSVTHGHIHPQQTPWRHAPNPIIGAPGLTPQGDGTVNQVVIRGPMDAGIRYSVGVENQSGFLDSPRNMLGFDGISSTGQPYVQNPHVPDRANPLPLDPSRVPSENIAVHREYLQVTDPSSAPLFQKNINALPILQTTHGVDMVKPDENKIVQGEKECNYVEGGVPNGVTCLEEPEQLAHDESSAWTNEGRSNAVKPGEVSPSTPLEGVKLSVERLSFLPELIASVKRAALEGAEEVKTQATETDLVENDSLIQSDHVNHEAEPEVDYDSDDSNNFKIEPTKAEAEAIARGLQTIKNDDLEEIRELGSGTYGSVYHGKWKGSDVAIKRIKASCFAGKLSERERLIADFWKEALILGSLHHPNVVSFYGIVRDGPDGSLATVTEFMVNGSLKQFLKKKDRTIDRRKRLIIAMDAAFGMEYLHGKNIVHFDLKCENLLVNMRDPQRPVCKVGDLGLSKVKQQTLVSGGVRGTLPWMAPELLSGKSNMVSEKIDVYSFGIVMWELLTGEEPYADMHCASIIGGMVNNTLRPKIPAWCDPEWKALMESCWAFDPSERPSFSEISHKLRNMAAAMNVK